MTDTADPGGLFPALSFMHTAGPSKCLSKMNCSWTSSPDLVFVPLLGSLVSSLCSCTSQGPQHQDPLASAEIGVGPCGMAEAGVWNLLPGPLSAASQSSWVISKFPGILGNRTAGPAGLWDGGPHSPPASKPPPQTRTFTLSLGDTWECGLMPASSTHSCCPDGQGRQRPC